MMLESGHSVSAGLPSLANPQPRKGGLNWAAGQVRRQPVSANILKSYAILINEGIQTHLGEPKYPVPKFSQKVLARLCEESVATLSNVQPLVEVTSPCLVVGDLNGSLANFIQILHENGLPPAQSYVFLGNFINFGSFSLETITLALALMNTYPEKVILLRGSSEESPIRIIAGLEDEITDTYGTSNLWPTFMSVFSRLPYAALASPTVLCTSPYVLWRYMDLNTIRSLRLPEKTRSKDEEDIFYSYANSCAEINEMAAKEMMAKDGIDYMICGDFQADDSSHCWCDGRIVSITSSYSDAENCLMGVNGTAIPELRTFTARDCVRRTSATFCFVEIPECAPRSMTMSKSDKKILIQRGKLGRTLPIGSPFSASRQSSRIHSLSPGPKVNAAIQQRE